MPKILFVPRIYLKGYSCSPSPAYAINLICRLADSSKLTILIPQSADDPVFEKVLRNRFGGEIEIMSWTEILKGGQNSLDAILEDHKPFVNSSTRVMKHVMSTHYDWVVFDVMGAGGFACARAKRLGLGLKDTRLSAWLWNCHEFFRLQRMEPPNYPDSFTEDLEIDFAERYCLQFNDLIIAETETIKQWVIDAGYEIDVSKVIRSDEMEFSVFLDKPPDEVATPDVIGDDNPAHTVADNHMVSICVAHYNDAVNLGYLLRSIAKNDYCNFEVVIVDDGSTEAESIALFKMLDAEYGSPSWRFITKPENESLGPTRNRAVHEAKGEFIFFADSDDLVSETIIADLAKGMETSGVDCLTCPLVFFEGSGPDINKDSIFKFWMPLGACVELGVYENPFGGANFCVKKSVYESLGGFRNQRGDVHEDWEFLSRLVSAGYKMDVMPKASYFYRIRPGSWLQSAVSKLSIQNLRSRIINDVRHRHDEYIRDLLIRVAAENDRMRSSAWKLDRKIVKQALSIVEKISEKNRSIIENNVQTALQKATSVLSFFNDHIKKLRSLMRPPQSSRAGSRASSVLNDDSTKFATAPYDEGDRHLLLTELGLPIDSPIFGMCGNFLAKDAGYHSLRMLNWLRMMGDQSFFIILGESISENNIGQLSRYCHLNNFRWMPPVNETQLFYSTLSGIVITSWDERMKQLFFQALSCGVPIFSIESWETKAVVDKFGSGVTVTHDPEHKDFADCFIFWKKNLETYKRAAAQTTELIRQQYGNDLCSLT